MLPEMRLLYFDITRGNWIGFQAMRAEFGFLEALSIAVAMQLRLVFRHPFSEYNKTNQVDARGRLSQRQMAPMIALYTVMQEKGYAKERAIEALRRISAAVAVEFLKFNVPIVRKQDWAGRSRDEKMGFLNKITSRFFNAEAESSLSEDDSFQFNVSKCYFAYYAQVLGVKELGPLFCESDRMFFDHYQKDIRFERNQTLAIQGQPCDFQFFWK